MDKAKLFAPRLPEADVELPVGTVRVRGVSRFEVTVLQGQNLSGPAFERKLIAMAMVNPALTEDEVKCWQEASPAGEMEAVGRKIRELSGMDEGAEKSGVPDVRDDA